MRLFSLLLLIEQDTSVWRALYLRHLLVTGGRQIRWFRCGWIVGELFDRLPGFATIMFHVGRCDDFLSSSILLVCHLVQQLGSRLYGIAAERDAHVMFIVCFIEAP